MQRMKASLKYMYIMNIYNIINNQTEYAFRAPKTD